MVAAVDTLAPIFRSLFGAAQPGLMVEIRPVHKAAEGIDTPSATNRLRPRLVAPDDPAIPELDADYNWYFAVCLRSAVDRNTVAGATIVWCDVDVKKRGGDAFDLASVSPPPTLVVSSSPGNFHLYWALGEQIEADEAVRIATLASAAFGGDPKVLEAKRVMRLPGSLNHKYDPPKPCEVVQYQAIAYDPRDLETKLMAAAVAPYWADGNRHAVSQGVGAVLARASWSQSRAEEVIREVCRITKDREVADRVRSIGDTYGRHGRGETVSASGLREVAEGAYKTLLDALGITARDGELILDGEVIGAAYQVERDVVQHIVDAHDWAYADGTLHRWNGRHWEVSTVEAFTSYVFSLLARIKIIDHLEEKEFPARARLATDIANMAKGMLALFPLPDAPSNLISLKNLVYSLETGETMEHKKEHSHRDVLPVTYDPDATCPTWERVVAEWLDGPDTVAHLQEWFGYILTGRNPWQRFLWLYGPPGHGKSTVLHVAGKLLGSASVALNARNITEYKIAGLAHAKLATCSEISRRLLQTATVKALTGGDPVDARHPYGRPFSYVYQGNIMWLSNGLPPTDEFDGMERRLVILTFAKKPQRRDVQLWGKLADELPGILNWSLAGYRRWHEKHEAGDWPLPASAAELVEEYRQSNDYFARFGEDEMELDPTFEEALQNIYQRYCEWAKERNAYIEPQGPRFFAELRKLGMAPVEKPKRVDGKLVRVWRGGRLTAQSF